MRFGVRVRFGWGLVLELFLFSKNKTITAVLIVFTYLLMSVCVWQREGCGSLIHWFSHHAVFLEIHGPASISLHSYPVHGHPHFLHQALKPTVLCGSGIHWPSCQLQPQRSDTGGLGPRVWWGPLQHPIFPYLLSPHVWCQQENPHPHPGDHTERILLCGSAVQPASRGQNVIYIYYHQQ